MEIYQLKVFLAVARCLNFTEAAESLNLTQPAVSAKIKSLESDLKAPLFDRLGRQIQLTELGQYLVIEAKKLVELEANVAERIEKFKQSSYNQIAIGCSQGIAQNWLPKIIYQYRKKHPKIKTKLEVFDNLELLEKAIKQNNIDLGFSELVLRDNAELERRKIASAKHSLIVASNSRLAKKNWQTLADIKQKPLVLLSDRFASHQVFVSRLAELGLKITDFPQIETVDTIALMRTYLTQGDYIGFASDLEFQAELDSGVLSAIDLQEFAFPAHIYLSLTPKTAKAINKRNPTPVDKFLALFPDNSARKSPTFLKSDRYLEETITINLGVQNGTIPSISAGLVLQQLRLLEHFLPRTGRYARVKYDIQWHNYSSGMPIAKGLRCEPLGVEYAAGEAAFPPNQKIDIGILGDYPLLQSAIANDDGTPDNPTQLVSFVSINPDGDGNAVIVPKTSKLETIEDLKGETIAFPVGSSAHGMLLRTLSNLDLLDRVQLFPINNSQLKTSSHLNIAKGFAYFSPFHQLANERGNFKYLFDGNLSQLPGFYGVVVSQSFSYKYPEIIVSYLQALIAAQNWLSITPSAFTLVSKWTKVKPTILDNILGSSFTDQTSSLFSNDWQIRSDWLSSHITQLQTVPNLQNLQSIKLDSWIQPEFLQTAQQNCTDYLRLN